MGKVKRMPKIEATWMEPDLEGHYHEITKMKHAWKCVDCGRVWNMRGDAQSCGERGHRDSYDRIYGGYFENGVHVGGSRFTVRMVYREKPEKTKAQIEKEEKAFYEKLIAVSELASATFLSKDLRNDLADLAKGDRRIENLLRFYGHLNIDVLFAHYGTGNAKEDPFPESVAGPTLSDAEVERLSKVGA